MKNRIEMFKRICVVALWILVVPAFGQQMNFSQFTLTPLLNNPSLMSLSEEIKVDFGYRNQFGGKQGNYATPFVSAYKPFYIKDNNDQFRKFGAGGVQMLTDRTGYNGMFATSGFSVAYAHITNLSKVDKISFGLQPGIFQRRIDAGKITTGSQWDDYNGAYDPNRSLNENLAGMERRTFLYMNAGITYVRYNLNGDPFIMFALGGNNLTRPNVSLNTVNFSNPISWNFQASVLAFEDNQFQIKPSVRHVQVQNLDQTNIGSQFFYKLQDKPGFIKEGSIGLGLWYSTQNALVTALEINQRDWAFAFSYDFLTSSLGDVKSSTGAPEIIVGFRKYIGKRKKGSDISASGMGGGKGNKSSDLDEPKKVVPSPTEMNAEPVAKPVPPATPKKDTVSKPAPTPEKPVVDPQKPAVEKVQAPDKPVKEEPAAQVTKPAAKKPAVKPARKPAVKPAAAKGKGKKRPQSNLSAEQKARLADVVTPDEYLGTDPYKGTQQALTEDQLNALKKQPRFGFNGYDIDQDAVDQLKQMASILKSRPKIKLEIGGFGCDMGGAEVTRQVSLGRAESVRRQLVALGVPANQIKTKAYGLQNPIQDNGSDDGKVANRRVQFKFLK